MFCLFSPDYNDIVQRVVEMPCGVSIKEMFSQSIAVAAVTKLLSLHGTSFEEPVFVSVAHTGWRG